MNYQTSCLCYLPQPSASADNWDLGIDNSWYHAQTHSITANSRLSSVAGKNYCRKRALGYSIIFLSFIGDILMHQESRINPLILEVFNSLTKSSKMSLWWTWMVINVSNFVLTTLVSSLVVCSMSTFNSSKNAVLVCCITFLSYLAFVKASVESRVHIIWIPSKPTYGKKAT